MRNVPQPCSRHSSFLPHGSGVRTFKLTEKTGDVAAAKLASLSQQVMIISAEGIITRTPVKEKDPKQGITSQGRSTQGVG